MTKPLLLLSAAAALLFQANALAQSHCEVPFEAYVTDLLDVPVTGDVDVTLNFYDVAEGDVPLDCRRFPVTAVQDGWLRVTLDECSPPVEADGCNASSLTDLLATATANDRSLYIGLTLDAGDEMAPRFAVGAVPVALSSESARYADEAGVCQMLDGFDPTDYVRGDAAIDADTLQGHPASDFLAAGADLDASTLGGLPASDFLGIDAFIDADLLGGIPRADYVEESELTGLLLPDNINFDVLNSVLPFTMAASDTPIVDPQDGAPIVSRMMVSTPGTLRSLEVTVDIDHADISELTLTLTSPAGTGVTLYGPAGGAGSGLSATFPADLAPASGAMTDFVGELAAGEWTLALSDTTIGNVGTIQSWSLTGTVFSDATMELDADLNLSGSLSGLEIPTPGAGGSDMLVTTDGDGLIDPSVLPPDAQVVVVHADVCPPGYAVIDQYFEPESSYSCRAHINTNCGCGSSIPSYIHAMADCTSGTTYTDCRGTTVYRPTPLPNDWYTSAPTDQHGTLTTTHRDGCHTDWEVYSVQNYAPVWSRCIPEE